MFDGFEDAKLPGARDDVRIHAMIGGEGPPLLLLHGFPQTHVAWRRVAPVLATAFRVVVADLRGYGQSSAPEDNASNTVYSKRAMAEDMLNVMGALGHDRFMVAGHDRGGRVAYRLALDAPEAVEKLAVLEIAPTFAMWRAFDADMALRAYHWTFLAQPAPMPERMLMTEPTAWLEHTLKSWTLSGTLAPFADGALDAYRAAFGVPRRIAAFCADYRAGAGLDLSLDISDLQEGHAISCPTLLIAGRNGFAAQAGAVGDIWGPLAPDFRAVEVECGHFPMEEAPAETAAALLDFFAEER
jgi:haloacetate dehalogenase